MKRLLLAALAVFLVSTSAWALFDDNSENTQANAQAIAGAAQQQGQIGINDNDNRNTNRNSNENVNRNTQGQQQGQGQAQGQGQMQGQAAIAAQGQGQMGIVDQGNAQAVNVEGDESKYLSNSWPAISGSVGVSQAQAYSIFGGLGVSSSEEYKVAIEKLQVIHQLKTLGYLTEDEALAEVKKVYAEMQYATKTKRVLGIFCKTSGRNLLNGLGLLSWDSFWKEGEPKPIKTNPISLEAKPATVDKGVAGNRGYVNQ